MPCVFVSATQHCNTSLQHITATHYRECDRHRWMPYLLSCVSGDFILAFDFSLLSVFTQSFNPQVFRRHVKHLLAQLSRWCHEPGIERLKSRLSCSVLVPGETRSLLEFFSTCTYNGQLTVFYKLALYLSDGFKGGSFSNLLDSPSSRTHEKHTQLKFEMLFSKWKAPVVFCKDTVSCSYRVW